MINKVFGKQVFKGGVQQASGYIRRQTWTHPIAASATALKILTATSNSTTTTITPSAQPDFARVITVTPGGTTADVAAGSYVVTGTNIRGEAMTETLTFLANATGAQTTTKAFKTVTNVLCPIQDGASATFSIGVGDALGLDRCMSEAAVLAFFTDGVLETTAATVTFSATDVALNTADPNTSLANTKHFAAIFVPTELTQKNGTTA